MRENKRYSILQKDTTHCYFCGNIVTLQWHEVFFGTANRQKSIDNGCCIRPCEHHHRAIHNSFGKNSMGYKVNMKAKRDMQKKFEETHTREEFMKLFGRNYL